MIKSITKKSYLLVCILLSACVSNPHVYSDYDKDNSFTSYKTFSWVSVPPLVAVGDFPISKEIEAKATNTIRSQLSSKGFTFVDDPEQADFVVAYTLGARDGVRAYESDSTIYENKDNWLWGKQYHSHYFDLVLNDDLSRRYIKGVIAIDVFDGKLKAPVWHGKATKSLDESEISSDGSSLAVAIKSVLSVFPPTF